MYELNEDLLDGVVAIAEYLNKSQRQTYYLLERGLLPAFKLGSKWQARKSTITRHIERLEAGEVMAPKRAGGRLADTLEAAE